MSLFTAQALDVVLAKMTHRLRLFWPAAKPALATKGAMSQACYRLGARPVVALFHQVFRPLATMLFAEVADTDEGERIADSPIDGADDGMIGGFAEGMVEGSGEHADTGA